MDVNQSRAKRGKADKSLGQEHTVSPLAGCCWLLVAQELQYVVQQEKCVQVITPMKIDNKWLTRSFYNST